MTHEEWSKAVNRELDRVMSVPLARASGWLYREAYYDGYELVEAVKLALDYDTEFRMIRTGWMGPKGAK